MGFVQGLLVAGAALLAVVLLRLIGLSPVPA
jgi:hypothetical protein